MVLELKSGFQSLAFKVQIMNHSLGDLVTGLEGRSHVPGAGLSRRIGGCGSREVRLPGAKADLDIYHNLFLGFLAPAPGPRFARLNTCAMFASQTHQLPPIPFCPSACHALLSGKGHKVHVLFSTPVRLSKGAENQNKITKPINKRNKITEFPTVSFLIERVWRASPKRFHLITLLLPSSHPLIFMNRKRLECGFGLRKSGYSPVLPFLPSFLSSSISFLLSKKKKKVCILL